VTGHYSPGVEVLSLLPVHPESLDNYSVGSAVFLINAQKRGWIPLYTTGLHEEGIFDEI
jgi:hypothetical protein